MPEKHFMSDFKIETVKAAPAVGGTIIAASDLEWSEIAAIATVVYIALQGAYTIYKWVKEVRSGS